MPPPRPELPPHVAELSASLAELPGTIAVVLGGSRATNSHRPDSDWDLGVYFRSSRRKLDPSDVRRLGHPGYVSELGEWGPIVNGGAWLTIDDTPVDILFRDLDAVERWLAEAREGRFEVLSQNGHIVGAPTYLPAGELALCRPLSGELPCPDFPDALAQSASRRWAGRAQVALMFAASHAKAADTVCCTGMLAGAVLCKAHALLAERREWVLNEKLLVERAGLDEAQALFADPGQSAPELTATVTKLSTTLQIEPLTTR